ncbi:MAG: DUF3108 domain-containing protein [Alphaproteobacteria bacterium]|nr:DUF3108 domain-containing protein [Alphaproteobacteria bacterium]MCB9975777.1 DUF3108 domain-containing protein [Rhodospirillales bacterium]
MELRSVRRAFGFKSLLVLGAISFIAAASGQAQAQKAPKVQKMKYEVYASGLNAVTAEMQIDLDNPGTYRMIFGAATQGMLASMVPWQGTFESKGWLLQNGHHLPEMHESIASWKQEKEVKTYHYGRDGKFKSIETTYTTKKPKKETPDPALTDNTTDVLSATLDMMKALSKGSECNGYSEIYDGKRRYAMEFQHQRYVMIKPTRYNIYSGPAVECIVEVKPRGGEWHKKPRGWLSIQEQGRERGTMPTVWFAMIGDKNPVAVPVRVRVKTAYGTLFMHLTYYETEGVKLSKKD